MLLWGLHTTIYTSYILFIKTCIRLESPGEKEGGPAKENMEENGWGGGENSWALMGTD